MRGALPLPLADLREFLFATLEDDACSPPAPLTFVRGCVAVGFGRMWGYRLSVHREILRTDGMMARTTPCCSTMRKVYSEHEGS